MSKGQSTKHSRLVERIGDLNHAYVKKAEGYRIAAARDCGSSRRDSMNQLHAAFSKAAEDLIDLIRDR